MIVFGCAVSDETLFERLAARSISALAEDDSLILLKRGFGSLSEPYDQILDEAVSHDDLEAVVLMHEDVEINEPRFLELVRHRFADRRVGLLGGAGARACPAGANWWDGRPLGNAISSDISEIEEFPGTLGPHYAEVADGYLLVVSPQVARTVRFSDDLRDHFHGYDVDFCFRVRARGYLLVLEDFANVHASSGAPPTDARWLRAAAVIRRRWNPALWPPEWRGSAPYGFFR